LGRKEEGGGGKGGGTQMQRKIVTGKYQGWVQPDAQVGPGDSERMEPIVDWMRTFFVFYLL